MASMRLTGTIPAISRTSARLSRAHNDANVLCLGQRFIGPQVALDALDAFLATPFDGGRHAGRVAKLDTIS